MNIQVNNITTKLMETKQTTVEWIKKELDFLYQHMSQDDIKWFFDKAKQMEQDQIEEAFNSSYWFIDGREYYEKTYGNNN